MGQVTRSVAHAENVSTAPPMRNCTQFGTAVKTISTHSASTSTASSRVWNEIDRTSMLLRCGTQSVRFVADRSRSQQGTRLLRGIVWQSYGYRWVKQFGSAFRRQFGERERRGVLDFATRRGVVLSTAVLEVPVHREDRIVHLGQRKEPVGG